MLLAILLVLTKVSVDMVRTQPLRLEFATLTLLLCSMFKKNLTTHRESWRLVFPIICFFLLSLDRFDVGLSNFKRLLLLLQKEIDCT